MSQPSRAAGHAFISYVREDKALVDGLQKALEAAAIPIWRDTRDLWPGQDWQLIIRRAISRDALAFVACFSTASLSKASSYQNEELVLAIDQLRQRSPEQPWLIPVRFDDCAVPDLDLGAGRTLASIQHVDLFGDARDEQMTRLITVIRQILGPGRSTPSLAVPARSRAVPGHSVVPAVSSDIAISSTGAGRPLAIEGQDSGLLFARAVEQLGSDKAPVRIGGLYTLEHVADENIGRTQRIVDLICGYLRMPYARPGPVAEPKTNQQQVELWEQEHQVRTVAQRILSEHLRPSADGDEGKSTNGRFWPDIDIDLTGAILIGLNFDDCRVRSARFDRAEFYHDAQFIGAQFGRTAWFSDARFNGDAVFIGARFEEDAWFDKAHFERDGRFDNAHFGHFQSGAVFDGAHFEGDAWFGVASFNGGAYFRAAHFGRELYFGNGGILDIDEFDEARIRLGNGRTVFKSPMGWKVEPPSSEADGRLEGLDGIWGHLVRADSREPAEPFKQISRRAQELLLSHHENPSSFSDE